MENITAPVTLVGFGMAGAFVAEALLAHGIPLKIVDEIRPGAASLVGPGQINPLASRRLHPAWRLEEALRSARSAFDRLEQVVHARLFHEVPILRLIKDERQAEDLGTRLQEPDAAPYIRELTEEERAWMRHPLKAPFGCIATCGGGWLDVPMMLQAYRHHLTEQEPRVQWNPPEALALLDPAALSPGSPPGTVIWCEGWRMRHNPLWSFIDDNPAKGEWMRVRLPEFPPTNTIINGPCWIQPLEDGTARVGSAYGWAGFEDGPTLHGQASLVRNLSATCAGAVEILSQHVGVRPIVRDTRPVVGHHPEHAGHFILNGLGSKGALYGPWMAELLLALLLHGTAPPREVDVRRFWSPST